MREYKDARHEMMSGDILMVKATGFVSRFIRVLTGESINHVALVLHQPHGVFVVEMREGKGWQMMPASQWMEAQAKNVVLWGKMPTNKRGAYCFESYAMKQRDRNYSYWTLLTVWLSQLTRRTQHGNLVCSTFVQRCWAKCEYHMFPRLADPGDFLEHAQEITRVI